MDPNSIRDVRHINTNRPEDTSVNKRIERKPDAPADSRREFKEVASSRDKKLKKTVERDDLVEEEEGAPSSIFDLSRKAHLQKAREEEGSSKESAMSGGDSGQSNLFQNKPSSDNLPRNAFATAQSDLSSIQPASLSSAEKIGLTPAQRVAQAEEIIDVIADKIYTLKIAGQVDTTIEMKFPPAFAGSSVTITTYDSAAKEFNISFTHLTQEAKKLLDQTDNMNSLKQILDSRGVTVHMIMTTTQATTPIMAEGKNSSSKDQQPEQDGQQKNGRQQQHGK